MQQAISKSTFSEVIELINLGQFNEAERVCRDALLNSPEDVNMLGLLGAILTKMKKFEEAEGLLRKTISLAPTFAKAHEDLGFVLLEMQKPDEAVEILQKATRLDPALEFAFVNLGKALAMTGRGKEADEAFEKSFSLSPERKMLVEATEFLKKGQFENAEKICREILNKSPNNVDAIRLLGRLSARLNRLGDAERFYRKVLQITPDFTAVIIDLAKLLHDDDRFEESIQYFDSKINDSAPRVEIKNTAHQNNN